MKNTEDANGGSLHRAGSAPDMELESFKRERNEALLSRDAIRIRAMVRKWNKIEMPADPKTFWGAVHKAITGNLGLPRDFRLKSKAWLTEHKLTSFDDGDLDEAQNEKVQV
jgi:hypothetical protein